MAQLQVELVPVLSDNYIYLAHEPETGATAVVDPAEAKPALEAAEAKGWTISHILNTHHHGDHTGGNREVQQATGAPIAGPSYDAERIPGIDVRLSEGDTYSVGNAVAKVIFTPGHTRGHVSFWFERENALFSGDTLFALGCGRLFEGDAATMWQSLQKLRQVPDSTRIYCGHEYTRTNARCALQLDPDNAKLQEYARVIDSLRDAEQPTLPAQMGMERDTNPFLRADDPALAQAMAMPGADPVDVFAKAREIRNGF
jgi:hydroxyacylglutathione hydrolase